MKLTTIQHRRNGRAVFTTETQGDDDRFTTLSAVRLAAWRGVSLAGADLAGMYLAGLVATEVDLRGADLTRAQLRDANLLRVDLANATLVEADLTHASLNRVDLSGADVSGARLAGADLSHAILDGVDIRAANLRAIRDDVRAVLDTAPREVAGLLLALRKGRIDGSTYTGACACLVGTIANVRGCNPRDLERNDDRPAERWFLAIRPGDVPARSQIASITEDWIVEWQRVYGGIS